MVSLAFWRKPGAKKKLRIRSRDEDAGLRVEFTALAPEASVFLGQSAYLFLRYAESAARHAHDSSDLDSESTLAVVAEECFTRFSLLAAGLDKLKVDRVEAMSPFIEPTREFERRTRGRTWVERLACTWITMSFLQDVWRRLAQGLPKSVRADVIAALSSDRMIQVLFEELQRCIEREPSLKPELAMWSRRLIGDTMLMAESALAIEKAGKAGEEVSPVFTEVISAHSLRMSELGLTP